MDVNAMVNYAHKSEKSKRGRKKTTVETLRSEAFSSLKPFCVQLTKEHSRANIARLFAALQLVEVPVLQDLQEYVIFPLRVILKHPKKCSQDLYLDLFTCMEFVLGHTSIGRWDLFYDIFNTATSMLSCPTDQSKVAKLSEELKIAIIQTLRTLVKHSEHSVVQKLYSLLCLPLLGHAVSLLLNIAETERARNLRLLAIECLLDLSQADSKYSPCLKADIGGIYASFLPGISVALCKIITGDTKQGYAVISKAIYVWMRIVSLVMDDKLLDTHRKKQSKQDKTQNMDPRLVGLVVMRDPQWVSATGSNLAILAKQLAAVRSHSSWRVRMGLVECAEHLLLHCTGSMKECVPTFLEILVSLIGDDYSKVANGSRRALELFSAAQVGNQPCQLTQILEENLHKLATSLPRQIQTAEEEDKLSLLSLLSGYLSLLGSKVKSFLLSLPHLRRLSLVLVQILELDCNDINICTLHNSCSKVKSFLLSLPHLRRLSLALVQILELDCNDIKIVEEQTTLTGHGSSAISEPAQHRRGLVRPKKYFKNFTNERIFQKVCGVCQLLGYYGDIQLLVDHFLDIFHESSLFKPQATLVINELMLGTTGETVCVNNTKNGRSWHKHSKDELDTITRMLVDEYLSPANFDLVTSVRAVPETDKPLEQRFREMTVARPSNMTATKMNKNILQISLYLEGFGNFAKVVKYDFSPFLMTVLYPVLEKLGDDTAYISNAAWVTLWDICDACSYRSLDELIRTNADYLMNAISLGLRHFHLNKRCPLVLKVMLQHSSAELLPLVDDTIKEILESLDDNFEEDAALFMGVLKELTRAVVRWFPEKDTGNLFDDTSESTQDSPSSDNQDLKTGSQPLQNASDLAEVSSSLEGEGSVSSQWLVSADSKASKARADADLREAKKLTEYFSNLLKLEKEAEGDISEEDLNNFRPDLETGESGQYEDAEEDLPSKRPPAQHVVAVREVVLRCRHIVASRNPRLKLLVLDTMQHGMLALKPHQDELLPLIHQVWPSFSLCFTDEEKLVTIKALEVLTTVAKVGRDFVKQRVLKDVLPKLASFLHSQGEISVHAGSAYQYTVNYKLQMAILTNVASIVELSGVRGSDLDLITTSCVPYLHSKQPVTLQKACLGCCRKLVEIDPDLLWLKLVALHCPKSYTPPTNVFLEVKTLKQPSAGNPYTVNVTKLLTDTGLL